MSDDYHPVELAAHAVVSGPLDSLHERFEGLEHSQVVLLTRLQAIEKRLVQLSEVFEDGITEKEVAGAYQRAREMRVKMASNLKVLKEIERRVTHEKT